MRCVCCFIQLRCVHCHSPVHKVQHAAEGTFVTKVFRSRDYTALLYALRQLFTRVDATKPQASRGTSAEIFVVCAGFKAPAKVDPRLLDPRTLFQVRSVARTLQSVDWEKRIDFTPCMVGACARAPTLYIACPKKQNDQQQGPPLATCSCVQNCCHRQVTNVMLTQEVEDVPAPMGPAALLKKIGKKDRQRAGYADGASTFHRAAAAADWVMCSDPMPQLALCSTLELTGAGSTPGSDALEVC